MLVLLSEPAIVEPAPGPAPFDDANDSYLVDDAVNWNHIASGGRTLRPGVTTTEVYQILDSGDEVLITLSHGSQTPTDGVSFTFPNIASYRVHSRGEYTSSETWELSRTVYAGINSLSVDLSGLDGGFRYRVFGTLSDGPATGDVTFEVMRFGAAGALEGASALTQHVLPATTGYPQLYEFRVVLPVDPTAASSSLEITSSGGIWQLTHEVELVPTVLPDQNHIDDVTTAAAIPPTDFAQQDSAWLELAGIPEATAKTLPDPSSRNNADQNAAFTEVVGTLGMAQWVAFAGSGTAAEWQQAWESYLSWLDGTPDYPFPYTGTPWPWGWGWSGYFSSFVSFQGWLDNTPIYTGLTFPQA